MKAALSGLLAAGLAGGLAGGAVGLVLTPSPRARLSGVLPPRPGDVERRRLSASPSGASRPGSVVAASLLGGLGLGVMVSGWTGLVVGTGAAVALLLMLRRLEPRVTRLRRRRLAADLPLAVDLLAACLVAGRPPTDALAAVAGAVGGPLADELARLTARLRLGADEVTVWHEVAAREDALGSLGRTMARSLETGGPMADSLLHLASDLRRRARTAAQQRARSVGVHAAAPLGLCFLPAFVLVGIVPTVASAFASLLR